MVYTSNYDDLLLNMMIASPARDDRTSAAVRDPVPASRPASHRPAASRSGGRRHAAVLRCSISGQPAASWQTAVQGHLQAVTMRGAAPTASSTGLMRTAAWSSSSILTTAQRSTTTRNGNNRHSAHIELDHANMGRNQGNHDRASSSLLRSATQRTLPTDGLIIRQSRGMTGRPNG